MNKMNDEVERRVNMKLMAKQVQQIHCAMFGKEEDGTGGICGRVAKCERRINWITGIGTGVTVVVGWFLKGGK
jgi:hypothetical protein